MVASPRGARCPGAIAIWISSICGRRAMRLSITAEERAGTLLAPEMAVRCAARAEEWTWCEKRATNCRPSARSR